MLWTEKYPKDKQPSLEETADYIKSPYFTELCTFAEDTCKAPKPAVSYSSCSMAPGWNIKYRKSGRALFTLYPAENTFSALVVIGEKEQALAELELTRCTKETRQIYESADAMNGARWLMLTVETAEALEDAKRLIVTRLPVKNNVKKSVEKGCMKLD